MSEKLNKLTLEKEDKDRDFGNPKSGKRKKKGWRGKGKFDNSGKRSFNAPVWHLKNAQMVKDLASIPFNKMAGFPIKMSSAENPNIKNVSLAYIRSFFVDWWAGVSDDFRSLINEAATNLWTLIRSRNSGATNYQSSDIFINIIFGCLDIVNTIKYTERFFKITQCYSTFNRLIPRMLFQSMGLDFDDFISNIANYRGRFNNLLAKASTLVIPDVYPIYQYTCSFYEKIFKDRDSTTGREQIYIVGKKFFHIYDSTFNTQGGGVRLMTNKDLGSTNQYKWALTCGDVGSYYKFGALLDILETQLEKIITDEDCNIIFGDLIKAYGDHANFIKFAPISEQIEQLQPEYDEEFLEMLHNGTIIPKGSDVMDGNIPAGSMTCFNYAYTTTTPQIGPINDIYQDAQGHILTKFNYMLTPQQSPVDPSDSVMAGQLLLDSNDAQPSPEKVMLMTRLHSRYKLESVTVSGNTRHLYTPVAASAVLMFEGYVYLGDVQSGVIQKFEAFQYYDRATASGFTMQEVKNLGNLLHFDWAPIVYIHDVTDDTVSVIADINNVVNIDKETINNMHHTDLASLLNVPYSGSF